MPTFFNRTRNRDGFQFVGGSLNRTSRSTGAVVTTNGFSGRAFYEVCVDSIEAAPPYKDPHGLALYRKKGYPARAEGYWQNVSYVYSYSQFNPVTFSDDGESSHVNGSIPSVDYLVTEALARGNPFANPDIDVPNFLWELKDFPRALRDMGRMYQSLTGRRKLREALSDASGAPISVQFGWKPLLSDLRSLVNTAEIIQKRLDKLKAAGDENKRSFDLSSGSLDASQNNTFGSLTYARKRQSNYRWWVQFRDSLIVNRLPNWTLEDARSIAFSYDLSAATIWNSFPWSWLVDYLFNVGSYLETFRNRMPYLAKDMCIMINVQTDITYTINPPGSWVGKVVDGRYMVESKNRHVRLNPTAKVSYKPFLSPSQLGNLAALSLAIAGRRFLAR